MAGLLSLVIDVADKFNPVQELQQLLRIGTGLKPEEINFLLGTHLQLYLALFEQFFATLEKNQKHFKKNGYLINEL